MEKRKDEAVESKHGDPYTQEDRSKKLGVKLGWPSAFYTQENLSVKLAWLEDNEVSAKGPGGGQGLFNSFIKAWLVSKEVIGAVLSAVASNLNKTSLLFVSSSDCFQICF